MTWTIILPVQHLDRAKSRLHSLDSVARACLAQAFAADCLRTLTQCSLITRIIVVTPDDRVRRLAEGQGADSCSDPGTGLNSAIELGLAQIADRRPSAVLVGDIPSLRPSDLTAALTQCRAFTQSVIPDAEGIGSVLLTGRCPSLIRPKFDGKSASAHVRGGAKLLPLDLPRLRRDVDTPAQLRRAAQWGLGPASTEVLAGPQVQLW